VVSQTFFYINFLLEEIALLEMGVEGLGTHIAEIISTPISEDIAES
jgi:hypothetical protein